MPSLDLLLDGSDTSFLDELCQGDLEAFIDDSGLGTALSPDAGGMVLDTAADEGGERICRPLTIRGSSPLSTSTSFKFPMQPVANQIAPALSQRPGHKRQHEQQTAAMPVKHRRMLSPEPCGPLPPRSVFSQQLETNATVEPCVDEVVITKETILAQIHMLGQGHQVGSLHVG